VRATDERIFGGFRTEISPQHEYTKDGIRWYAFSVLFPADWKFADDMVIVSQVHTSQKTAVVSPPLAFIARGRYLEMEMHSNLRSTEGADPITKENSSRQIMRLERIVVNQWYCILVRADWSNRSGQGGLRVWLNGESVYESVNLPNSYETWLGNWPKSGLYVPGAMAATERSIYLDFIHVGGAKSWFEEMAALTPCARQGEGTAR
jgi:hypothetical protein